MAEQTPVDTKIESPEVATLRYPNAGEITKLALAALMTMGILEYGEKQEWNQAIHQSIQEGIGVSEETAKTIMDIEAGVAMVIGSAISLIWMRRDEAASAKRKHAKEATTTR